MKKDNLLVVLLTFLPGIVQAEMFLVDQIKCVVCGPVSNTPFTDTDTTWKRSLDNKFVPIEQQIQREIVSQQMVADHIPVDPNAVEKYIEGIKKQNNFSQADLEMWFGDVGRTLQEGLTALGDQYNNEYFMHYKFKSQLVPTEDEIVEYFEEHPAFIDGWYDVRATRVDYDAQNYEATKAEMQKLVASKGEDVPWTAPNRIQEDDLAKELDFIRNLQKDEIYLHELPTAFELYQLVASEPTRLVPLEQRRTEIVEALNRKKLEKMLADYNKAVREYIDVIALA